MNTIAFEAPLSAGPTAGLPKSPRTIPHRKIIRSWTQAVSARNTAYALTLVGIDLLAFAGLLAATLMVPWLLLKLPLALLCGLVIARLFVIGHDACHQSFTPHRRLNRWIGRLVFLPSLTPYSLWDIGHNVVHHGYTNLKDFDMVWAPHTFESFRALPRWRQWLDRAYRSGWGPGLYYFIEMWWLRMYFPSRRYMPSRRPIFLLDGLLVSAFALAWIGLLYWGSAALGQTFWVNLLCGFVIPFAVWNCIMGFVIYAHHTHTQVAWYEDKASWSAAQPFVSTTVHLRFRRWMGIRFGAVLHHIMEHTAHHVDMGIPLYRLVRAQAILEAKMPDTIVVQDFGWRWYFDTARRCKLYDYQRHCWTDYAGNPSSAPVVVP